MTETEIELELTASQGFFKVEMTICEEWVHKKGVDKIYALSLK